MFSRNHDLVHVCTRTLYKCFLREVTKGKRESTGLCVTKSIRSDITEKDTGK